MYIPGKVNYSGQGAQGVLSIFLMSVSLVTYHWENKVIIIDIIHQAFLLEEPKGTILMSGQTNIRIHSKVQIFIERILE